MSSLFLDVYANISWLLVETFASICNVDFSN